MSSGQIRRIIFSITAPLFNHGRLIEGVIRSPEETCPRIHCLSRLEGKFLRVTMVGNEMGVLFFFLNVVGLSGIDLNRIE